MSERETRIMLRLYRITLTMLLLMLLAQFNTAQEDESADRILRAAFDAYIVQPGDSLYQLAQRFNTSVEALAEANNITESSQIYAGQSILVPAGISSYVEEYVVQPGDTLFGISKRFNTSIGILQGLNDIRDGRSIFAGQSLVVPSVSEDELQVHIVQPDDSLYGISRRYNTAISVLRALNGIVEARDLREGASILVPIIDETRFEVYEVTAADSLYSVSRRFATTEDALITLNGLAGPRDLAVGQTILVPRIDEAKFEVYVIQPGDSLFSISRQFNTTVAQLRALNGIGDRLGLTVGRSILVPRVDDSVFESVLVQPGDSLFGIAQRYDVSVAALQALNRLADPRDIRVNQSILVPKLDHAELVIHVIELGDNLTEIAKAYDTSVDLIQTLNGITNPSLIQLGDTILVPRAHGVALRPGFGFGIHVFQESDAADSLAKQVARLGVDWVKIDVPWSEIEAEKGIYDFSTLDAIVAAMELTDVNILLNIFAAPAWSRTIYTEKLNSQMRDYGGPPETMDDFATFLANLTTRYARIVDAYEIWKSPNLLKFWTVPVYEQEPEMTADGDYGFPDEVLLGAQYYLPLLKVAYETIKSHDPQALVVTGGLAPVGFSDGYNSVDTGTYLQNMLAAGAAEYSDAVGAVFSASAVPPTLECCDKPPGVDSHYESFLQYFPELMEFYEEVLAENGLAGTPIVVTQVGWGTSEGANIATASSGFEWLTYTSEDEQALYVTQAFEIVQARDSISSMFLYNLNGCAVGDQEACFFSLVDAAGAERPVYAAYEAMPKA